MEPVKLRSQVHFNPPTFWPFFSPATSHKRKFLSGSLWQLFSAGMSEVFHKSVKLKHKNVQIPHVIGAHYIISNQQEGRGLLLWGCDDLCYRGRTAVRQEPPLSSNNNDKQTFLFHTCLQHQLFYIWAFIHIFMVYAVPLPTERGVQHLRRHRGPRWAPGRDQPGQDRPGGRDPSRHWGLGPLRAPKTLPRLRLQEDKSSQQGRQAVSRRIQVSKSFSSLA